MSQQPYPPAHIGWGSPIEREVRNRIQLSVAAYGYEIADTPIMPDAIFDRLATQINRRMGTCHPLLDEFFAYKFSPMTGMWIHEHPELWGIKRVFERYYSVMRDYFDDPNTQRLMRS